MGAAGEPYASWARGRRQFIAFDARGNGRIAEVFGDLRTAERIAVLVPGVGTRLADFDRGLGGVGRRALSGQAARLYLAANMSGARVAVVAWLGYEPPAGLSLDAARDLKARDGAVELVRFVRGLRAGAEVTLVGHSYGAIVAGLAARLLPQVTDVVALGAPGLGVRSAAELRGCRGEAPRVWAALAENDWVRRVPELRIGHLGHGRRPSTAGFGARLLPTDGVDSHDDYLSNGTATLPAVASIVNGTNAKPTDGIATAAGASGEATSAERTGAEGTAAEGTGAEGTGGGA